MARDDTTNDFEDERMADSNQTDDTLRGQGVDPSRVDDASYSELDEDIDRDDDNM